MSIVWACLKSRSFFFLNVFLSICGNLTLVVLSSNSKPDRFIHLGSRPQAYDGSHIQAFLRNPFEAQQLAEENKELFKTAGRYRICTPDAATCYPKPFNSPLHTVYTAPSIDLFASHYLDGLLKSCEIYRNKNRGGILFKMNIWDILIELHYR